MGDSSSSNAIERTLGLIGIMTLGPEAIDEFRSRRDMQNVLGLAAGKLDELGTEEALEVSNLIRENPEAANSYVQAVYGGWPKMFDTFMTQNQLAKTADEYERGLLAGPPAQSPEAQAARDLTIGSLRAGVAPPTSAMLTQFYDEPSVNPASWGINPSVFTGESIQAAMAPLKSTGAPDLTKLVPRKDIGSDTIKPPSGYAFTPDGALAPIPGSKAYYDRQDRDRMLDIERQIGAEAARRGPGKSYTWKDWAKDHPEDKAFMQRVMLQTMKAGGGGEMLLQAMQDMALGGEDSGAPTKDDVSEKAKELAGKHGAGRK